MSESGSLMRRGVVTFGIVLTLFAAGGTTGAPAATEQVVYEFQRGANPYSALIDVDGVFYGTTAGAVGGSTAGGVGTVFALRPPSTAGAAWTSRVLHRFTGGNDGAIPYAGLVALGRELYGTTSSGGTGNAGTVYSVRRHGGIEAITHTFTGSDGRSPIAGLINVGGALYGTTLEGGGKCADYKHHCGTVFELTPPAIGGGAWTETVLYRFKGGSDGGVPYGGLIEVGGTLYGTTEGASRCPGSPGGCGTVFALTPPGIAGGAWTETVLYRFQGGNDGNLPFAGLIAVGGALYGTTSMGGGQCASFIFGCGTVFELTPPAIAGEGWTETVLYRFKGGSDGYLPGAGLINVGGAFYGTTRAGGTFGLSYGTVFELTPPTVAGGIWGETVLHSFVGGNDGIYPVGGLIDVAGALYGTTEFGGGSGCGGSGCGTVFQITP